MGAWFTPSVTKLFMAHWEEESVFRDHPPELVCYKGYIDNLIMVWQGDMVSLDSFMQKLNITIKNISLTWNVSKDRMVFLDLEINKEGDNFKKCNYFKPTNRNAYIPLYSCHHCQWLCNILRGSFIRLRHNYTFEGNYLAQSQVLSNRFQK